MKKFFCLLLVLMLFPVLALGDSYTPKLGMTMEQFINKYNSLGAPFNSSLMALQKPLIWTDYKNSKVGWCSPDKKTVTSILLVSADPKAFQKDVTAGLDEIQIYVLGSEGILSLISVATRCASIFAPDLLGTSLAPMCITNVMKEYYENGISGNDLYYGQLNSETGLYLQFFVLNGDYYFKICNGDFL